MPDQCVHRDELVVQFILVFRAIEPVRAQLPDTVSTVSMFRYAKAICRLLPKLYLLIIREHLLI